MTAKELFRFLITILFVVTLSFFLTLHSKFLFFQQRSLWNNIITISIRKVFTIMCFLVSCLALMLLVASIAAQNLICNGDFENVSLTHIDFSPYQNFFYKYAHLFNGPSSCWYSKTGIEIQIKQFKVNGIITLALDLLYNAPYTACQNITLKASYEYELSFQFIIDIIHVEARLNSYVNNAAVYSGTMNNTVTPASGTTRFTTTQVQNIICFNTTNVFKPTASLYDTMTFGSVLDNVTLVEIGPYVAPTVPVNTTNSISNNSTNTTSTGNNTQSLNGTSQTPTPTPIPTPPPPAPTPSSTPTVLPSFEVVNITILVNSYWNPYSGILFLQTNWTDGSYGIPFQYFQQYIQVEVNGQLQQKRQIYLDINRILSIKVWPNNVYITQFVEEIKVYLPSQVKKFQNRFNLNFYNNGKKENFNLLSSTEQAVINKIEPVTEQVMYYTRQAFMYLNIFHCSFFILGVIDFWNLTLLYNFLNIKSVPRFVEAFFSKMINFFFSYNSLSITINKLLNPDSESKSLVEFDTGTNEKILTVRRGHVWFGFVGASSNFLANNFDSLVLLAFFLLKCLLFKLLMRLARLRFPSLKKVRLQLFLSQFAGDLLCFAPFFIISALSVFCYLGQTRFLGKINSVLHVQFIHFLLLVPCLSLVKPFSNDKKKSKKRQKKKQKNKLEKVVQLLFILLIPTAVVINHNLGFMVVVSLLVLWKVANFINNIRVYSKLERFLKTITNLSYVVFHGCFLAFCILDYQQQNAQNEAVVKYCGLVAIFTTLIGGGVDIFYFFVQILRSVFKVLRFIYKKCHGNTNVNMRSGQNIKNLTQNSRKQIKNEIDRTTLPPKFMPESSQKPITIIEKNQKTGRKQQKRLNALRPKSPRSPKDNNSNYYQFNKIILIPAQKNANDSLVLVQVQKKRKYVKREKKVDSQMIRQDSQQTEEDQY